MSNGEVGERLVGYACNESRHLSVGSVCRLGVGRSMVVRLWFLYVFNQVVSRPGAISTFTQAHLQPTVHRERRDFISQR